MLQIGDDVASDSVEPSGNSAGPIVGIVIAVIVLAGGAFFVVKSKKK